MLSYVIFNLIVQFDILRAERQNFSSSSRFPCMTSPRLLLIKKTRNGIAGNMSKIFEFQSLSHFPYFTHTGSEECAILLHIQWWDQSLSISLTNGAERRGEAVQWDWWNAVLSVWGSRCSLYKRIQCVVIVTSLLWLKSLCSDSTGHSIQWDFKSVSPFV